MAQCIVVADDLTGSNATGVLLKKQGYDTYTVLDPRRAGDAALSGSTCLAVPTDSRSVPAKEAYDRVFRAVNLLKGPGVKCYSKRIDSTLRGNLGSETDAFLDALGPEYLAVCVPCFPASGRILCGGYLLVNGVPLERTEAASDPKNPIDTPSAALLMSRQSKYPVSSLLLEDLAAGREHLANRFRALQRQGSRIILCDAVTQEDIDLIADALADTGIPFVAVDPGVFTAAAAKRLIPVPAGKQEGKVLCAIGSVNGVARRQVETLLKTLPVHAVILETGEILESPQRREQEIRRVTSELLGRSDAYDISAVIGCGIDPDRRVPFEPYVRRLGVSEEAISGMINQAFAEIACAVLTERKEYRGVYSTGGDITAAINDLAGTAGLQLLDEVVPLAGYGRILGGRLDGLHFVSKGGMVGDADAMVTCVRYMQEHF